MQIREATPGEVTTVLAVFDGAMLETDTTLVREAIDSGDLLVAVADDRVLGACLLSGTTIDAIAVRPGRRGQGIGRALVATAGEHRDRLVARFDVRVRPFWESLGFEIEPTDQPDRFRGVRRQPVTDTPTTASDSPS